MKIGVITNLYPPYIRGGAEIVALRIAQGLKENLQHVFIISTKPYENLGSLIAQQTYSADIPTYRFYPLNLYHYLKDARFPHFIRSIWHVIDIFNLHSYYQLKKILKREKPDVIITHNLMGIGFLTPRLIARLAIKHVHVVHDVQLYNPSGIIIKGQEHSIAQRFYNTVGYFKLMKLLFSSVDIVISPSHFLMNFYTGHGFFTKAEKKILPNPLSSSIKKRTIIPGERLELLYLGQLSYAKGIAQVSSEISRRTDLNIHLTIVGAGAEVAAIRNIAAQDERISYLGWQATKKLAMIFKRVDLLILPTLCYDNSPSVVYEALNNSIPVIVSDIGGAKEIVQHGSNGWIFEAGDWEALLNQLNALTLNKDLIQDASQRAQASVSELTMNKYITQMLDLLQRQIHR